MGRISELEGSMAVAEPRSGSCGAGAKRVGWGVAAGGLEDSAGTVPCRALYAAPGLGLCLGAVGSNSSI